MIDIGMAAGEDFSDKIPELIETLRPIVGDRPLSIDTLNPNEIKVAAENGIDFVLSLDLGNNSEVQEILKEKTFLQYCCRQTFHMVFHQKHLLNVSNPCIS